MTIVIFIAVAAVFFGAGFLVGLAYGQDEWRGER